MIATHVEDLLTPFSFEEAAAAMRYALMLQLGKDPDAAVLALALAKTALETGRWQKIHRYNWGNIKAGEKYVGMYTCFRCNEVIKGKVVWFSPTTDGFTEPPGHPQTRFRAYANHYDGAVEYVRFVSSGRYGGAWSALLTGDAAEFVHRLKLAGYFTADESAYLKGVVGLRDEFLKRLRGMPVEEHQPDRDVFERAEQMLALWFHEQRGESDDGGVA